MFVYFHQEVEFLNIHPFQPKTNHLWITGKKNKQKTIAIILLGIRFESLISMIRSTWNNTWIDVQVYNWGNKSVFISFFLSSFLLFDLVRNFDAFFVNTFLLCTSGEMVAWTNITSKWHNHFNCWINT